MPAIQTLDLKSGATITMHSKLTPLQARQMTRIKAQDVDGIWQAIKFLATGWTLKDPENADVELPFDSEGFGRADWKDIVEIQNKVVMLVGGGDPNA